MQNSHFGNVPRDFTAMPDDGLKFIVENLIGRIQTVTLVQVKAVKAAGVNPVGTVDVQPMIAQLDGNGNAFAHGIIHNIPYFRLQGGTNAVIIDPKVGDIGMCGFVAAIFPQSKPIKPHPTRRA